MVIAVVEVSAPKSPCPIASDLAYVGEADPEQTFGLLPVRSKVLDLRYSSNSRCLLFQR